MTNKFKDQSFKSKDSDKIETVKGAEPVAKGGDQQKLGNETVPGASSDENVITSTDQTEGPARKEKFSKFMRETHSVADTDVNRIYNWFTENPAK